MKGEGVGFCIACSRLEETRKIRGEVELMASGVEGRGGRGSVKASEAQTNGVVICARREWSEVRFNVAANLKFDLKLRDLTKLKGDSRSVKCTLGM